MDWWHSFRDKIVPQSRQAFQRRIEELQLRLNEFSGIRVSSLEMARLPVLTQEFGLTPRYLSHDPEHPVFNPGVAKWGGEIVFVSQRAASLCPGGRARDCTSQPRNTVNLIHRYDEDLNPIGTHLLDDSLIRSAAPYGIEDLRLFAWKGSLWAVAGRVAPPATDLPVTQMLIRLDGWRVAGFHAFSSPNGHIHEKNWVPLVKDDRLFLIYSFEPFAVYEYTGGGLELVRGSPGQERGFPVRGSSPFIPWREHFAGLTHSVTRIGGKLYYSHAFVVLDDEFAPVEASESFFIQHRGVEYVGGLIEYKGDLLVSYGVPDRAAAFCILPYSKVSQLVASMGDPSKGIG